VLGSESFDFNFELDVDAYSGACTGLCVRDAEDSTAVIEALADGVDTTGAAPLALLLDNRPSNHTPEVDAALEPSATLRMRSTLGRPQNKAHVEGAFGLFSQTIPPIVLDTRHDSRSVARQLAVLMATTWARAINRRPRTDRGGRSRAPPSKRASVQRCATCSTRNSRSSVSQTRERHVRLAIAAYTLQAIVDGISIFAGKRRAGTLPGRRRFALLAWHRAQHRRPARR